VAATLVLVAVRTVTAHPAPFSYVDIRIGPAGVDGSITVHDFDVAHDLGIDPPDRLRDRSVVDAAREELSSLMASRMTLILDGARASLSWTGIEPLPERQSVRLTFRASTARAARAQLTAVMFPYDPVHQTFVNVYENDQLRHQAILDDRRTTADYYSGTWQGTSAVLGVFIPAGVEHILIGSDHVLFLVGLLLLGGSLWRLATIVTSFTIGHSVTLSLAALDVVSPPATLVEPAIALSIIFVGADNLLVQRDLRTAGPHAHVRSGPRDIRPWIAGVFGLVHGFGFAGVLKELGLPLTALGWSLFSFNMGVEIGQLGVVGFAAWMLAAIRRRRPAIGRWVVSVGSGIVVLAGVYWFVQRVFLGGGG
jgi:hypothetical protein